MTAGDLYTETWTQSVLSFWFDELGPEVWFIKDDGVDEKIRTRFSNLFQELSGQVNRLDVKTPEHALATVIVLDQFPRNMFRGEARSFATDGDALRLAKEAIARGFDKTLSDRERQFLYMPFQHAEDRGVQADSIKLYEQLDLPEVLDFARRHKQVIDEFGRFPHRNAIMGRPSTDDEKAYLEKPGSGF